MRVRAENPAAASEVKLAMPARSARAKATPTSIVVRAEAFGYDVKPFDPKADVPLILLDPVSVPS
jgi:hypothetical protein